MEEFEASDEELLELDEELELELVDDLLELLDEPLAKERLELELEEPLDVGDGTLLELCGTTELLKLTELLELDAGGTIGLEDDELLALDLDDELLELEDATGPEELDD